MTQPEHREVVAIDLVEQLHAEAFELVGADGQADAVAGARKIVFEERVGEIAHRQPRCRNVRPRHLALLGEGDGGVKFVRAPAQAAQCRARCVNARRLAQQFVAERQHLVGADDERAGDLAAHILGLRRRQRGRNLLRVDARIGLAHARFNRRLVDVGRLHRERYAGCRQQLAPRPAARRQHDLAHASRR